MCPNLNTNQPNPFTGSRYATANVARNIDPVLQMAIWNLIDIKVKTNQTLDYLQVFEISQKNERDVHFICITHSQEQPEFHEEHKFLNLPTSFSGKVWVIDAVSHTTMLLPEDY